LLLETELIAIVVVDPVEIIVLTAFLGADGFPIVAEAIASGLLEIAETYFAALGTI
jgi:hypothetical protein